jgi:hypothetical protein
VVKVNEEKSVAELKLLINKLNKEIDQLKQFIKTNMGGNTNISDLLKSSSSPSSSSVDHTSISDLDDDSSGNNSNINNISSDEFGGARSVSSVGHSEPNLHSHNISHLRIDLFI